MLQACVGRIFIFSKVKLKDDIQLTKIAFNNCSGQWREKSGVELPYTIGHENAGWVHAVGDAVTNVKVGDKVILHPLVTCGLCRACRFGDDVHCEDSRFPGISHDGGYSEYIKTGARSIIKLDDSLEPADVAALADAGLTAYHAVAKAARMLRPGNFVVMIGAGGLGHIGIQVIKAISGATLVVIDRNADALALAKKLGADYTVQAKDDEEFVKEVMDLTGGKGAEAVIDFVAEGGSTSTGVKMIRRAGNYYVVGESALPVSPVEYVVETCVLTSPIQDVSSAALRDL